MTEIKSKGNKIIFFIALPFYCAKIKTFIGVTTLTEIFFCLSYVNSDDVEQLFSAASGTDLKPIFNLYLRTIHKLEVRIKQISDNKYLIQLVDFASPLPMDVRTDTGTKRLMIDDKGILVTSSITPVADPDTYYLKRVILE